MERPRVPALVAVALLACPAIIHADGAPPEVRPPPAFVELHADLYGGGFDIEAVRRGEFQHPYYPTVDINDFDWVTSPVNKHSWWIRVEELRFLIPLIASNRADDQALLQSYFSGWREAHTTGARPNSGAWREPMTVARRGMVFVYWRMREGELAEPDAATLLLLDEQIAVHAAFLLRRYDRDSNHGLEEAMGFHELTRVTDDAEHRGVALERLIAICEASVSIGGLQREHSPGYHFLMLQSVDRYGDYLAALETTPGAFTERLDQVRARLRRGGYYLYDQGGRVLQLGDTDSLMVADDARFDGEELPALLYDPDGGLVVFKGQGEDRRYVALSITSSRPPMRRHFHNDVAAVFFSHNGETLLGGAGAYEYSRSQYRRFLISATAHSRVFHHSAYRRQFSIDLGRRPWMAAADGGAEFGIRLDDINCVFKRTVKVPPGGDGITVVDTLRGPSPRPGQEKDTDPRIVPWQLGPDIRLVRLEGKGADGGCTVHMTSAGGRRYRMRVRVAGAGQWTAEIVRGSMQPVQGWYSPRPMVKRERAVVIITVPHEHGDVIVTTGIDPVE